MKFLLSVLGSILLWIVSHLALELPGGSGTRPPSGNELCMPHDLQDEFQNNLSVSILDAFREAVECHIAARRNKDPVAYAEARRLYMRLSHIKLSDGEVYDLVSRSKCIQRNMQLLEDLFEIQKPIVRLICPFCGAGNVVTVAMHGSVSDELQTTCVACREYFYISIDIDSKGVTVSRIPSSGGK